MSQFGNRTHLLDGDGLDWLATGSCGSKAFVSMSDKCVLLENKNVMSLITNTSVSHLGM